MLNHNKRYWTLLDDWIIVDHLSPILTILYILEDFWQFWTIFNHKNQISFLLLFYCLSLSVWAWRRFSIVCSKYPSRMVSNCIIWWLPIFFLPPRENHVIHIILPMRSKINPSATILIMQLETLHTYKYRHFFFFFTSVL